MVSSMSKLPEYLTVGEFADFLRLSLAQVYSLVKRDAIVGVRLGGSIRIPRRELERLDPRLAATAQLGAENV